MLSNKNDRRLLYAMFANAGIIEKEIQHAIILQFTEGESASSHDMSQDQIYQLRKALAKESADTPSDRMRKKMIHYGHLMNWKVPFPVHQSTVNSQQYTGGHGDGSDYGDQFTNSQTHELKTSPAPGKIDLPRLDAWCEKYGEFHKPLNSHSFPELCKLVTQFQKVYRTYIKNL